ncbi:hypothetical protein JDV02_008637 [Purpureocillium takamizusanense]|uniref:DUF833 domain-containing protein n=1 Tax=Purpureocillium takamizusanense TaxID=2060973 RepID=A0A9Q8QPA3_9HYPO|nr:uncharacterized protein JDV02_008637 [Purpureocillium takamizusanense]UNI22781.1 hypothetical protein JDV02_008637 [Purpureocillium takamizusanense]
MCIVLFTTAHPKYSLILIDNRDEYILRPTSRPGWWTHPTSGQRVLSARDLQRAEKGTWFGITRDGLLAVLTNYRELSPRGDAEHPVHGIRSRGLVVNAWLGGLAAAKGGSSIKDGVHRLVANRNVQGVGGFSMVGAKLRRKGGGIAIVSNRASHPDDVPLVDLDSRETWGLSNTVFDDPKEWPKVTAGKRLLDELVSEAGATASKTDDDASQQQEEQEKLIKALFSVLDVDTLPQMTEGQGFEAYISQLKHSIFVPPIGDQKHREAMQKAMANGRSDWNVLNGDAKAVEELLAEERPDAKTHPEIMAAFETGMYGTQRQTVLLVDLEGNVTFVERALWDANGHAIPRGDGDVAFKFKIDGWDDES